MQTPTKETTPETFVVEQGLGPVQMALISKMQKEAKDEPDVKVVAPHLGSKVYETPEINFDAPAPEKKVAPTETNTKTKDVEPEGEEEEDLSAFKKFMEDQKLDEDAFTKAFLKDKKFKIKVNGKERDMTLNDLKSLIGREETFQSKYDNLTKSEEMKIAAIAAAAKSGDKAAQKKLQKMLVEFTGSKDEDEMLDKLDDIKDEFDDKKAIETNKKNADFEAHFDDVKKEVDYEKNLSTMQTSLKRRLSPKVFESYWNEPASRRAMYDLVASGRMEELLDAFDQELVTVGTIEKQLAIENDPEEFAKFFIAVAKRENAKKKTKATPSNGKDGSKPDGLDSISTSSKSRRAPPEKAPDFDKMSKDEFNALRAKLNLQSI